MPSNSSTVPISALPANIDLTDEISRLKTFVRKSFEFQIAATLVDGADTVDSSCCCLQRLSLHASSTGADGVDIVVHKQHAQHISFSYLIIS